MQVVVHPECRWEVCQKADALGSTERIIDLIERAPEGSSFAVGTEIHLVNRLAKRFAPLGKRVITPVLLGARDESTANSNVVAIRPSKKRGAARAARPVRGGATRKR